MPLYDGPKGAMPEIDYALERWPTRRCSATATRRSRSRSSPGYKWSNGAPVDANDVVFWFDLLQAAVKESAGQLGSVHARPDSRRTSRASRLRASTRRHAPHAGVNPGFFLNNQLQDTDDVYPLPSTAWNVDADGRPAPDRLAHNPADAKKIYDYLNKQGGSVAHVRHEPAVEGGRRPVQADSLQHDEQLVRAGPEPELRRLAEADHVPGRGTTPTPASPRSSNAIRLGSLDIGVGIDPSQLAAGADAEASGFNIFGGPELGLVRRDHQLQGHDRPLQQGHRAAVHASGARPADRPAGDHQGRLQGAAVPAYGPVPSRAVLAVLAGKREHAALAVQPGEGRRDC